MKKYTHSFSGTWGLAWGRFPGIAPGRNYGSIENETFKLPNESTANVTAVFLMNHGRTLRLTLDAGTPADQFPSRVTAGKAIFGSPGALQGLGLGAARDYRLARGDTKDLQVGQSTDFEIGYGETVEVMNEHQRRKAALKEQQRIRAEKRDAPIEAMLKNEIAASKYDPQIQRRESDGTITKIAGGGPGFWLYVHAYADKWHVGFMLGFSKQLRGRITTEQLVEVLQEAMSKVD